MGHKHHGKSSASFLNADEILLELNLEGNENFLDAGCGDGFVSLKAIEKYLPEGTVYAVDIFDESIKQLDDYKQKINIENLINIEADLTKGIPIDDGMIDVLFMLNVFHGFTSENRDDVINELIRLTKDDGKIAIMDFKPFDMQVGPPTEIRISPSELEDIFKGYNLKKVYLNEEIGAEFSEGKSHYLMIFKKE
ncbi:MAG: class I SAM-dependent methyltransferase [Methanobrevibacter sp.]|nr:class I SAM-dependent methyltransferase [Methanobrevibacter sp.]